MIYKSFFFSSVDRYGSLIIQLASIAALSRLLTPEEFGIYSIIVAVTALANTFRELGGANYLIQKPNLTQGCVRTAFTITFAMACLLGVVLLALAGAAAGFFSQPALRDGITIAALNFLMLPFSVTISALLRREMVFDALAACNLISNFLMAATSVGLAASGFSFMGPVWGSIAGNAALVALLLAHRRDVRIFRFSLRNWRDVVGFGTYSSGTVVINVLYAWSPQIILGRVLDMTAVGLYSRAFNVIQLFDKLVLDVINPVIMPAVAVQARLGADLKRLYLDAAEMISVLHWPFLLFVAVLAEPIVRILFGTQWLDAVPLVRMLALASLFLFSACLTYPVLVSIGRIRDTLTISLISVPPSLLIIFIASFFGIQAVAAAAFLTLPLQAFVALYFVCRRIGLHGRDLAGAIWKSAFVALLTTLCLVAIPGINGFDLAVSNFQFIAAALAGLTGWCLGLVVTRHPLLEQLRLALIRSRPDRWMEVPGILHLLRRRAKAAQP